MLGLKNVLPYTRKRKRTNFCECKTEPQHLQAKCFTLLFYCLKLTYSLTTTDGDMSSVFLSSSACNGPPDRWLQEYSSCSIEVFWHEIFPREREIAFERNRKYTRQEYFFILLLLVFRLSTQESLILTSQT